MIQDRFASCVTCGRWIAFNVRDGVWRHLDASVGQTDGENHVQHPAGPQKKVA